jgi:hypothetical protein
MVFFTITFLKFIGSHDGLMAATSIVLPRMAFCEILGLGTWRVLMEIIQVARVMSRTVEFT